MEASLGAMIAGSKTETFMGDSSAQPCFILIENHKGRYDSQIPKAETENLSQVVEQDFCKFLDQWNVHEQASALPSDVPWLMSIPRRVSFRSRFIGRAGFTPSWPLLVGNEDTIAPPHIGYG